MLPGGQDIAQSVANPDIARHDRERGGGRGGRARAGTSAARRPCPRAGRPAWPAHAETAAVDPARPSSGRCARRAAARGRRPPPHPRDRPDAARPLPSRRAGRALPWRSSRTTSRRCSVFEDGALGHLVRSGEPRPGPAAEPRRSALERLARLSTAPFVAAAAVIGLLIGVVADRRQRHRSGNSRSVSAQSSLRAPHVAGRTGPHQRGPGRCPRAARARSAHWSVGPPTTPRPRSRLCCC